LKSRNNKPKEAPFSRVKSEKWRKKMAVDALTRLKNLEPNPKCELYYESEFQLLVSVVLSAQTTDKMVNRCMIPIYEKGFTPETVLQWGQEKLLAKIKSIGLAPTKSKNVVALSRLLIEKHKGQVPSTRQELEALPGVGKKTASVILGEIFREPTLAVDTHVFRVTRRLGLHHDKTPEKAEKTLLEIVPESYRPQAHHWFILLGRYTCKSQKPTCSKCAIDDICPYTKMLA